MLKCRILKSYVNDAEILRNHHYSSGKITRNTVNESSVSKTLIILPLGAKFSLAYNNLRFFNSYDGNGTTASPNLLNLSNRV